MWNGPVIGAAIGGGGAAIAVASYKWHTSGDWAVVPVCAAIGAAIGLGIDAAVQSRITLYEAPKTAP